MLLVTSIHIHIYMYIYLQQQSKILLAKKGVENIIIPMKPTSKVHIREYRLHTNRHNIAHQQWRR